jgi:hypothetical protein
MNFFVKVEQICVINSKTTEPESEYALLSEELFG